VLVYSSSPSLSLAAVPVASTKMVMPRNAEDEESTQYSATESYVVPDPEVGSSAAEEASADAGTKRPGETLFQILYWKGCNDASNSILSNWCRATTSQKA
jgi:hypothetical protein